MFTQMHIRDFAIVDEVALDTSGGLTVLTGETGAGKSILIDALGLLLGDRADTDAVRHGRERAEITATFDLSGDMPGVEAARAWLTEQCLDSGDECVLRRVVHHNGRSRAFINGRPCTLEMLKQLGECLADLHGQHEHQSLLKASEQRAVVDRHGGLTDLTKELGAAYTRWREFDQHIEELEAATADRASRLDLLRFQVTELETLGLDTEAIEALDDEHRRQSNSGELLEAANTALAALTGENTADAASAQSLLHRARQNLERGLRLDPGLGELIELIDNADIQVSEAGTQLSQYVSTLDLDPQRLIKLERRVTVLHDLARKHRVKPLQLPVVHERLRLELDELDHSDEKLEELRTQRTEIEKNYRSVATRLSEQRRTTARELNKRISALMQKLGMTGGRFEIDIEHDDSLLTRYGFDRVVFNVSANPGQPLKPLAKVASGGELSRLGLAIQVAAADAAWIPTLVFDEIDAGIGGAVAAMVGELLRELGERRQVLCVTHLPQVASEAHHHVRIAKITDGRTIRTTLQTLEPDERVEEVARMLGGADVTAKARDHAKELIGS